MLRSVFPDRLTALREMYRVLRPGAVAAQRMGSNKAKPGLAVLAEALGRHIGSDAGPLYTSILSTFGFEG